ncbi:DMT family transporter [Hornefia butyriciproducens]|uniref:DMT family transporter n=1 Tax=Hornefia butyriciproducens TaxID=2652293 RepID=UPI002A75A81E|nr:EamA family transporter [Hornefia butyriciproducens]MCI7327404.1 EamA family transporter [Clostridiales bacterium]MDY2990515.1 EamA family transporter [Hornefia butyriciproducens]
MKFIDKHGWILVFLGAVCWSLNSPLVKYMTASAMTICCLRALIAGIALLPFLRPSRLKPDRWTAVYLLAFAGVCITVIASLSMTDAAIAVGMQYTALIWLTLTAVLRTRRFSGQPWGPVILILGGLLLFMSSGSAGSLSGNLIAASEGILFAVMTASGKRAGQENPLGLTCIANLFTGALVLLIHPQTAGEALSMAPSQWGLLLVLGIVQVAMGYGLYNLGLQYVSPQRASILALWEMILGPVWVALFLHEYSSGMVIAGFLLILGGICLNALHPPGKGYILVKPDDMAL